MIGVDAAEEQRLYIKILEDAVQRCVPKAADPALVGLDIFWKLLEFIDDVVDELDSRREVEYVRKILSDGTSAERQVQVYRDTGDLRAVVQALIEETRESVEQSARTYRV